jgi:UDPglucose 6-dehydrogenase
MDRYGIVGYGVVGKATHKSLLWNKDIVIHDKGDDFDSEVKDLTGCSTVFVCLPCDDTSGVNKLISEIQEVKKINQWCEFVIRSTVPMGTCARIQELIGQSIYYMPEFLRDRFWESDCLQRPIIIGSDMQTVPNFLKNEDTIQCTLQDAEVLKMMSNAYASLRITFANHFYDVSKSVEGDYNKIVDMLMHTQHNQTYLEADEQMRGFGGKCLNKDLDFIIDTFKGKGLNETLLSAIREDNKKWPTTIRES